MGYKRSTRNNRDNDNYENNPKRTSNTLMSSHNISGSSSLESDKKNKNYLIQVNSRSLRGDLGDNPVSHYIPIFHKDLCLMKDQDINGIDDLESVIPGCGSAVIQYKIKKKGANEVFLIVKPVDPNKENPINNTLYKIVDGQSEIIHLDYMILKLNMDDLVGYNTNSNDMKYYQKKSKKEIKIPKITFLKKNGEQEEIGLDVLMNSKMQTEWGPRKASAIKEAVFIYRRQFRNWDNRLGKLPNIQ